jgi:hypothetical protein
LIHPAFRKPRQEDPKFKASLGYTESTVTKARQKCLIQKTSNFSYGYFSVGKAIIKAPILIH